MSTRTQKHRLPAMLVALIAAIAISAATLVPLASAAAAGPVVEVIRATGPAGFEHPGIGFTADDLENARDQIRANADPWAGYYDAITKAPQASRTFKPQNMGDVDQPLQQYNIQWMRSRAQNDSVGALAQAIQYLATGEDVFRANALKTLRTWSNLDPAQYSYFTDAHIHTSIPLYEFIVAAEIIRYTEPVNTELDGYSLVWSDTDTEKFQNNVVDAHLATFRYDKNGYYNQFNYGMVPSIAAAIWGDDRALYDERIEWSLVNSGFTGAGDWNGSLTGLFREVPADHPANPTGSSYVQHMEMGRDQSHSLADVQNHAQIIRMLTKQGTKVDPVTGRPSTAGDAVNPYEFASERLLAGAETYARFDLGYDVPWYDLSGGSATVSEDGRGRGLETLSEVYYQYKYVMGVDVETVAPAVAEAHRQSLGPYYWAYTNNRWTQTNRSTTHGWEYLLALPENVDDADRRVPETGPSSDVLIGRVGVALNDGADFVRPTDAVGTGGYAVLDPAQDGTIAVNKVLWLYRAQQNVAGFRVKSDGTTTLELRKTRDRDAYATIVVPDTGGEWRWVTAELGTATVPSTTSGDAIVFVTATGGDATSVEIDRMKPIDYDGMPERLSPPSFADATVATSAVTGQELRQNFPAVDRDDAHTVTYSLGDAPDGASIDESGVLTWRPGGVGTTRLQIVASDGESVSVLPITIEVTASRQGAIESLLAQLGDHTYTSMSVATVDAARGAAQNGIGSTSDTEFSALLQALRTAIAKAERLNPELADGTLDYSRIVTSSALTAPEIASLVDGDPQTYWGNFARRQLVFDFGLDYRVRADEFGFLGRTLLAFRATGTNMYGSNDGRTWNLLTERPAPGDENTIQRIPVIESERDNAYRFLKFQVDAPAPPNDPNYPGMWTLADFRIYGERVEVANALTSVAIASPTSGVIKNRVVAGNDVRLTFAARSDISDISVTLGGTPATVTAGADRTWTATAKVATDLPQGVEYPFTVDYRLSDGTPATTVAGTSDASALWVSTDGSLINDTLRRSTVSGVAAQSESISEANTTLFNGVATDKTWMAPVQGQAVIQWDLGEGNTTTFTGADVLLQQDTYGVSVIRGIRFEGSVDGTNWTPLTDEFLREHQWQRFASKDAQTAFRYIRIFNELQIALAEIRVFGQAEIVNPLLSDGSLNYNGMVTSRELTAGAISTLTDSNNTTFWGDFSRDSVTLDFGLTQRVAASEFGFQARRGQAARAQGINVYGSNDDRTWTLLTQRAATPTDAKLDRVAVRPEAAGGQYRFFKLKFDEPAALELSNPGRRNLAEFRVWGQRVSVPSVLDSVSISSADAEVVGRVTAGDRAQLTFRTAQELSGVAVTIGGAAATASSTVAGGVRTWTATGTVPADAELGLNLPFTIDYALADGTSAQRVEATTDASRLFVSSDTGSLTAKLLAATVLDVNLQPHVNASGGSPKLFDNSIAGSSKTIMQAVDRKAAIVWDFGTAERIRFDGADALVQQDAFGLNNIGALRLEGSVDGTTWTPLTATFTRTLDWQRQASLDSTGPYRYLRIFNDYQIALMELRVFGAVVPTPVPDTVAPVVGVEVSGGSAVVSASDAGGLASLTAELRSNGEVVAPLGSADADLGTSATRTWPLPADLSPGTYTVRVVAKDAAGNESSAEADHVVEARDAATTAPARGALSHDNGWDTGILDGDYTVTMNLWWGENATRFTLYENGVEISSVPLTYDGSSAQRADVRVTGKANGTYEYTGVLSNSKGATQTSAVTVNVTQASPGTPVLSHDNHDRNGDFRVTADLWWGTNATSYTFYEGDQVVAQGTLEARTPTAQRATLDVSGKAAGSYTYRVEFTNAAGTTSSVPLTVDVE